MTINCKGKILNLDSPIVMGILNVTPDSFYDGGQNLTKNALLSKAAQMIQDGATILDIGGYSSRPNATHISPEEELSRVINAIDVILKEFPEAILSIDTFRANIAHEAINNGAALINDISGGDIDSAMWNVVKEHQVPYIIMHMRGTPQNMQDNTTYKDVTKEVIQELAQKHQKLTQLGIHDVLIDPGFGFAKNIEQNFKLLNELELFQFINAPLLAGLSRKSMIYKTLNTNAENALNGTTALNMIALQKGAKLLRVHDVKEAMECVTLFNKLHAN